MKKNAERVHMLVYINMYNIYIYKHVWAYIVHVFCNTLLLLYLTYVEEATIHYSFCRFLGTNNISRINLSSCCHVAEQRLGLLNKLRLDCEEMRNLLPSHPDSEGSGEYDTPDTPTPPPLPHRVDGEEGGAAGVSHADLDFLPTKEAATQSSLSAGKWLFRSLSFSQIIIGRATTPLIHFGSGFKKNVNGVEISIAGNFVCKQGRSYGADRFTLKRIERK